MSSVIADRLEDDRDAVEGDLGISTEWARTAEGKLSIAARRRYADLHDPVVRAEQFEWLPWTINAFVSALRPRVSATVASHAEAGDRRA